MARPFVFRLNFDGQLGTADSSSFLPQLSIDNPLFKAHRLCTVKMMAPTTNIKRPLRFWEQICSNMGVTMGFELEGKVTPQIVKDAFSAIQKEYPYLRTVLTQDMNQLAFVEQLVVWSILRQYSLRPAVLSFLVITCLLYEHL